jgi:Phosphopantetheine attachment site.
MSNLDKYKECFKEALELDMELINDSLKYNSVAEWDSIGHMTLMSALEEKFSISMDTDDIIDFSDFKKGIEILKKYSVDIK